MFFGRAFNGFNNFEAAESIPETESELSSRIEELHNVIYPAVSSLTDFKNAQMKSTFNETHKIIPEFKPESWVMIKNVTKSGKSEPSYEGPFKVIRRNTGGAYILQDKTGALLNRNIPASQMRAILVQDDDDDESYVVEAIIDHRGPANKREFLVKWRGYSSEENSWEPYSNFDDVSCIRKYHKRRKLDLPPGDVSPSGGG